MLEIKYSPDFQPGATKYLAIHNTGGLGNDYRASTAHLTPADIDAAHKERFGMLSSLGHWGGYNFFIQSDGTITQFRAIGEETAAQKGFNFAGIAISVCLAGNFTSGVDAPAPAQIDALVRLYALLPRVQPQNILPHRLLQSGTACYGSGLADDWARTILAGDGERARLQAMIDLYTKLIDLIRRAKALGLRGAFMGAFLTDCQRTDVKG